jgi:hypothetical protein
MNSKPKKKEWLFLPALINLINLIKPSFPRRVQNKNLSVCRKTATVVGCLFIFRKVKNSSMPTTLQKAESIYIHTFVDCTSNATQNSW